MILKRLAIMFLLLSFYGCVSLNSVSLTSIPPQRKNVVSADSSRFIIFFLNFDNDYVDQVSVKLKDKCQGGKVTGILTKDETTNYFLGLVIKKSVTATGYCLKKG